MRIGNKEFNTKEQTYVMGILNVTPDSFSDGGKYSSLDAARKRAEEMMKEGAAILDIGGESTRPGYTRISDSEEIARVVPVIEAVKRIWKSQFLWIPINHQWRKLPLKREQT